MGVPKAGSQRRVHEQVLGGLRRRPLDITDAWSVTAGWRWTRDTRQFKRSQWTSDFEFDLFYACPGNIGPDGLALRSCCKEEVSFSQSTPRVIVN